MEQPSYVLEVFEGPLDLLLYLIKKNKISIYDIPIAEISAQYNEYLASLEQANLEVTSEFVVMAAQLLYIKSRMLLPKPETDDDGEDPRAELVERLLEYSKYKAASTFLEDRESIGKNTFFKSRDNIGKVKIENVIENATPLDLFEIVKELLTMRAEEENVPVKKLLSDIVTHEVVSVNSKIDFIRRKLKSEKRCRFIDIFEGLNSRPHIVAMFLGVLELIKDAEISVTKSGGEIIIGRNDNNEQ